ncbi:CcdB family protein [Vannielia litorea]|uniref:CcdB family protein n=1 Tax=Vannielia litorea TaxID=1217970 RepID=UPI001C976491|nr:CcdB family protein [Vannielia litorea]MBY6046099.1 CcdB family protein [Vannielia litorea]MBY6073512.1 CcdB family protein [Vannielia litorea]
MARFDVYRGDTGSTLLLDIQSDLLSGLNTRLVVPLLPADNAPPPIRYLNPLFEVKGERYLMATQLMAAVPQRILSAPIASLSESADEITRATDTLMQGV